MDCQGIVADEHGVSISAECLRDARPEFILAAVQEAIDKAGRPKARECDVQQIKWQQDQMRGMRADLERLREQSREKSAEITRLGDELQQAKVKTLADYHSERLAWKAHAEKDAFRIKELEIAFAGLEKTLERTKALMANAVPLNAIALTITEARKAEREECARTAEQVCIPITFDFCGVYKAFRMGKVAAAAAIRDKYL